MIRFQCSNCNKTLGIADSEAGKAVKCPRCGTRVRIPGAPAQPKPPAAEKPPPKTSPKPPPRRPEPEAETEELAGVGEGEEFVDADPVSEPPRRKPARPTRKQKQEDESEIMEEDEEEPRRTRTKKKARRQPEEDEVEEDYDDEEKGLFSPNRIRGMIAILTGGVVLAFALLFPRLQDEAYEVHRWAGCGLAGVIFLAGIFYLIKG